MGGGARARGSEERRPRRASRAPAAPRARARARGRARSRSRSPRDHEPRREERFENLSRSMLWSGGFGPGIASASSPRQRETGRESRQAPWIERASAPVQTSSVRFQILTVSMTCRRWRGARERTTRARRARAEGGGVSLRPRRARARARARRGRGARLSPRISRARGLARARSLARAIASMIASISLGGGVGERRFRARAPRVAGRPPTTPAGPAASLTQYCGFEPSLLPSTPRCASSPP